MGPAQNLLCHPELVEGSWHCSEKERSASVQLRRQDASSSEETRSTPQPRFRATALYPLLPSSSPNQSKGFDLVKENRGRGYGDGVKPAEWSKPGSTLFSAQNDKLS